MTFSVVNANREGGLGESDGGYLLHWSDTDMLLWRVCEPHDLNVRDVALHINH